MRRLYEWLYGWRVRLRTRPFRRSECDRKMLKLSNGYRRCVAPYEHLFPWR